MPDLTMMLDCCFFQTNYFTFAHNAYVLRSCALLYQGQIYHSKRQTGVMCAAQELDLLTTQAPVAEQTLKVPCVSSGHHASLARPSLPPGSGTSSRPADVLAVLSTINTNTWQVRLALGET